MKIEGTTKEHHEIAQNIALSVAKIARMYNELEGTINIEVGNKGEKDAFVLTLDYKFKRL